MRRKVLLLAVLLVFALAVALPMFQVQAAPSAITYKSGFQVQNLGGVTATVSIQFFDRGTGNSVYTFNDTIGAGRSKTYYPIGTTPPMPAFPGTFDGSVVISSDQQVVAIANLLGDPGGNPLAYFDTTGSFSGGTTSINLPLIMRANFGFSTFFNIQNAGSAPASGNVKFSNNAVEPFTNLQPGAAVRFDQTADGALPTGFIGAATVTSTQPIVASVMQIGTTGFNILMGYNSFSTGGTSLQLPLIMGDNFGYYTGVQVQNTGSTLTNISLTFSANGAGAFAPVVETQNGVAAGQSVTFFQHNAQWGSDPAYNDPAKRYLGAGTVTNSAGNTMVAIVNQVCIGGKVGCPSASNGAAYSGVSGGSTINASAPLIMSNNFGYYTGIQAQNVGSGTCTTVQVTYSANTAGAFSPVPESVNNLAVGTSKTFLQRNGQWGTYQTPANKYLGGATIVGTGAGCLLAVIVNQVNPVAAGDQFSAYNAFNY